MLIARSEERESASEDGVAWWKEYRLRRDKVSRLWLVEIRYMARADGQVFARIDGRVDREADPETTWEKWAAGDTPSKAVDDVIGDTLFFRATSLSPVHARAVERRKRILEKRERVEAAREEYFRAVKRLDEWKDEQQKLFQKRHGHKAGDAYEKAFRKTRERLRPEYERLKQDVAAAKAALEEEERS